MMMTDKIEARARELIEHVEQRAMLHDPVVIQHRVEIHTMVWEYSKTVSFFMASWFARALSQKLTHTQEEANKMYRRLLNTLENGPAASIAEINERY